MDSSILHLLLLSLLSLASTSYASHHHHHHHQRHLLQSQSPQNIETFFPSIASPAFAGPTPPPPPPLPPPPQPSSFQPAPSNSSDRGKITTAVLATAASSFALSFLVFYIFHRFSLRKHRRHPKVFDSQRSSSSGRAGTARKGMIVDENGLDVLYWRDLVGGGTPKKCNYCNCVLDQSVDPSDDQSLISNKKHEGKLQELRLLPSNSISSSSHTSKTSNSKRSSSKSFNTPIAPPVSPVPPPTPPPPPPPPKAPPPPQLAKKSPAPPPPMPPMPPRPPTKNSAAAPAAPSLPPGGGGPPRPPLVPAAEGGRRQTKLKPLHWDKVTPPNAEHSMVWDRINDGSFRIDDDLMDTLFGYSAANQNNPSSNKNPSNPFTSSATSSATPTQICLLDPRKSQNVAIVLRSLGIGRKEILDALFNGRGLSHDALEKLSRISLTKEEETTILEFSGNPTKLADAESFLYHLQKAIPSLFPRINAMLFRSNYDAEILHIKKSIQTLELACKEIKSHGLFLKLLEAILKAGNRMNAGTARGNAKAFNLTALCKLSDVKSTDGKTTLLHFVVEEVVRSEGKRLVVNRNHSLRRSGSSSSINHSGNLQANPGMIKTTREEKEKEYIKLGLPVVGGLGEELANVKKAAGIDYDALVASCSTMGARMGEIRQLLSSCSGGDVFQKEMKGFLEASEEELKVVIEEQTRVMELVKRTSEYYQPGASKDKTAQPLQLFVIVRDFLVMFDGVCIDITRNMQKKPVPTSRVSSSNAKSETEKRPVARFPNLPPRFMSENSKSSSDSDSEDGF